MKIIKNDIFEIVLELSDYDVGYLVADDIRKFCIETLQYRYSEMESYLKSLTDKEKIVYDLLDILIYNISEDLCDGCIDYTLLLEYFDDVTEEDEKEWEKLCYNYLDGAKLQVKFE